MVSLFAMTEKEIIKGCFDGDRRCQNALYKKYYPLMSSIALRYCENIDDARQGVNLGFLKVLQSIRRYDNQYALATWIRNILVNHLIDEFRKEQKYRLSVDVLDPADMTEATEINLVEEKWEEEDLRSMLNELPEVTRRVFNLYAVDGYQHKEIARMLGMALGTSKWHVSDARKRLKSILLARAEMKKKGWKQ